MEPWGVCLSVVGCGLWRWDMDTLAKGDRFLSLMGAGDVSLGGKRRGRCSGHFTPCWSGAAGDDWDCCSGDSPTTESR